MGMVCVFSCCGSEKENKKLRKRIEKIEEEVYK